MVCLRNICINTLHKGDDDDDDDDNNNNNNNKSYPVMVLPCTEPPFSLNRTNYGFGLHFDNQKIQRLNHLIYMDDINL